MAVAADKPSQEDPDRYGPAADSAWRHIDWAAHQHWVLVDGTPVNYIEMGEGPPLLLIHGLAGSWQNWLETIPYFARRRRVLAPDLPGSGTRRCRRRRSPSRATDACSTTSAPPSASSAAR